MNINYPKVFIVAIVAMFCSYLPVRAAEVEDLSKVRHISGEIKQVDVKLGILELRKDKSPNAVREYKINKNDTRVTDPSDEKFLTIDDLHVGQHITVDIIRGQEEKAITKIIAEPYSESDVQQVTQTTVTTTTTTTR